jgi:hypothetical protein
MLNESDPLRWYWLGQAAKLKESRFLLNFAKQVQELNSGSNNAAVVFMIGKALSGHVSVEEETIFGERHDFDNRICSANTAISFYKSQLAACRCAVDVWSHVGIRCSVVKDIRVLIGKIVWETRDLALYKV